MVATGWIGFLVAVFNGLVLGVIFILIGFVLCWFAASMLAVKPTLAAGENAEEHAAANGGVEPEEPADIEARIKRRLEAMKQENPEAEAGTETEAET